MANANAQTHDIDLASPNLNLDKYKLGVSQFDGFNYRNSPFISHEIKNLYIKEIVGGGNCFINPEDYNDIYKIDNDNKFYRKNSNVFGDDDYHLLKTFNCTMDNMSEYNNEYLLHISEWFKVTYNRENKRIIIYNYYFNKTENIIYNGYTDNCFFYETRNDKTHNQTIAMAFVSADKTSVYITAVSFTDRTLSNVDTVWKWTGITASIKNVTEFATITSVDFVKYFSDSYNGYIGVLVNCCYTTTEDIYQETEEEITNKANKIIIKSREFISSNQSRQSAGALAIRLSYTVNENDYGISGSASIASINNISIAEYLFLGSVGNIFYAALLRKDTGPIVGFPIDGTITNGDISSTTKYGGISNTDTKQWETTEIRRSTNVICDGRFKTVTYGIWDGMYNKDVPVYVLWVGNQLNIQDSISQEVHIPRVVNTMANTLAESPFPTLSFYERIGSISGGDFWIVYYNREIANIVFAKETNKTISYNGQTTDTCVVPYASTAIFPWFSIDKIIGTQRQISNNSYTDVCDIYIKDTKGTIYKATIHSNDTETPKPQLKMNSFLNRYLLFNSLDYYNCYDTEKNVFMHYADGLISVPIIFNNTYPNNKECQFTVGAVAASYSTQYQADGNIFPGIQANAQIQAYEFQKIIFELADASVYDNELINNNSVSYGYYFYLDAVGIESKVGLFSSVIATSKKGTIKVFDLGRGSKYPIEENNMLYSIPLFPMFDESNVAIICNINGFAKISQVTLPRQGGKIFAIYYLMQEQEDFEHLFAIQNQLFAISENYIYRVSVSDNIFNWGEVVCSCENLIYLCSTPLSAFFWSPKNKTIYQFQGDNLFHRGQCIDEINYIIDVSYNPATNDIIMITDQYVVVLSEQYAFKINQISNLNLFNKVKFYKECFALFNNTDCYLYSYNKHLEFSKQNIVVITQFYGLGDNMLSETDCVFIRVFNAENETTPQTVRVGGATLTDTKSNLLLREYIINPNDWTEDGSYYIRYQPTYQKALGIQIAIESTVPITYIGVSNIPDTKMITKI